MEAVICSCRTWIWSSDEMTRWGILGSYNISYIQTLEQEMEISANVFCDSGARGKKLMITKLSWNIESLTFFPASKILCCWHWHRWHSRDRQHTEQRKHPRYAWHWGGQGWPHNIVTNTGVAPSLPGADLVSILISLDATEDPGCNITCWHSRSTRQHRAQHRAAWAARGDAQTNNGKGHFMIAVYHEL